MPGFDAVAIMMVLLSVSAPSGLRVERVGDDVGLVLDGFPPEQKARYPLFVNRCARCHELERTIESLTKGITPVTESDFEEKDIKEYVVRMMRKRASGISKLDAIELSEFLIFARKLAKSGPPPAPPAKTATVTPKRSGP